MVEILQRSLHLPHIPIAACAIMPIDRILIVELYSFAEVLNRLFEVKEAIPHESSSIKGWSIALIKIQHLVEIF